MAEGLENTAGNKEVKIQPVKKQTWFSRFSHDILGGDYLSRKNVFTNLPFLLVIAVLGLIFIANTYYAEKTLKEIERTKSELKELRFQYITTKATLMYYTKQTEIARRALVYKLKESTVPPYKIFYNYDSIGNILH
jgi:hypothetical protein